MAVFANMQTREEKQKLEGQSFSLLHIIVDVKRYDDNLFAAFSWRTLYVDAYSACSPLHIW